jgi:hypothetical protein
MPSNRRLVTTAILTAWLLSLMSLAAVPCRAQAAPASNDDANAIGPSGSKVSVASDSLPIAQPTSSDPADPVPPKTGATGADDAWHFAVSPYLWFPGVHGTASGPNGNGLGFRASPGDLLSNFRFGIMGAFEARYKRIVVPIDLMWIRLEDDKSRPLPPALGQGVISANIKATELLFTPKIGFRLINEEKIKIDALTGFRFWHFGESLNFNPSALGLNFNGSQNFVDPLVGGRIQLALSPKIVVNILGDVGGWDTGSQLEYQWAGLLGYRIKPALTLQAGYRYLNVNYKGSRGVIFDATTAGVVFGATLNLK